MRKLYRFFLAFTLCAVGAMNASAGDRVSLEELDHTFYNYDGFGIDAVQTGECEGQSFLIDQVAGCPIGDTNCNAWLDLSAYSKMYVKMAGANSDGELDGSNPRIFINRMITEGQFNSNRESSNCLVIPNADTWAEEYYTIDDDDYYVIDLRKILADFGFVHFHSIKGSAWNTQAIVYSIEVETGQELGSKAQFSNDVIELFFDFGTNISQIVKESGAKRVLFDTSCAKVKVNGENKTIASVEGFEDGRFYIFMEEPMNDDAVVEVTFTNSIGLEYTSGPNNGSPVDNFSGIATLNSEIEENNGYPYVLVAPTVMKTDPDDGSFNLPNDITITVTFDKNIDCAALKANANGTELTVSPSSGGAKEVTLTGTLQNGENLVTIDEIYPEMNMGWNVNEEPYTFTINIGKTSLDPDDQPYDLINPDYFANCPAGGIPEGFFVLFGSEERPGGSSYSSGPRMFDFGAGGDFTKGLYFREGYAEYGSTPGYELALEADKKYVISFNSAMWKDNGGTLTFKILDEFEEEVLSQTVTNKPNVNGSTAAVNGSTKTEISFVPEVDGNYIVRWDRPGFNEVLIANVSMKYMPNTAGYEYIMMLNNALEEAKKALEANSDERYQGTAYTALSDAIGKYEGWESTSPNAYKEAVAELEAATQALKNHRTNCDSYEENIKKAIDVVRQNASNKFANTDLYVELTTIVDKYHGTSEWVNIGDEETEQWQLNYSYDILTDDDALVAAVAELKDIANTTSLLFTEGVSAPENANGGKGTGIAVLIERLRLGAESLKAVGVSDDNQLVLAALNALTDDDEIADMLKQRLTKIVYNDQNIENPVLFQEEIDDETLESIVNPVDMTVFVKNPNTYKQHAGMNFNEENVPGWYTPDDFNAPGLTVGWNHLGENDDLAVDCMFQTWGSSYRVEQTIEDLPIGIYTVRFAFGERNDGDAGVFEDSYAYAVTSTGEEYQSPYKGTSTNDEDMYIPGIGQAFPFASNDNQSAIIEEIEVTDGFLTIGVNAGPNSHTFFNEVRVLMTAPLPGHKYEKIIDGDVNGDGVVDVADISNVITVMATGIIDPSADVNGDGVVDVADISSVITIMAEARRAANFE